MLVVVPTPPRRRRSPCHVVLSWRHEDHRQPCLPVGVCEHQLLDAWCAALITVLIFAVVAAIVAAIIAIVVVASAVLLLLRSAPNQHACQIPLQFPERVALIQLPRCFYGKLEFKRLVSYVVLCFCCGVGGAYCTSHWPNSHATDDVAPSRTGSVTIQVQGRNNSAESATAIAVRGHSQ